MQYAITGGCGFVGYRLAMALVRQQPNAHVSLLDIKPPPVNKTVVPTANSATNRFPPHTSNLTADEIGRIHYTYCNLCDASSVLACLSAHVDVLFHVASYGMSGAEMLNRSLTDAVNIGGTEHVLEACRTHSIRRLVYVSSYNTVYNGSPIIAGDETLPYPPLESHTDRYSQTKTIAEQLVRRASGENGLRTCVIRPAAIYGDGEERHLPRILATVRAGLALFAIGSAEVLCDWVYVDNLVHALMLAAAKLTRDEQTNQPLPTDASIYCISDNHPTNNFTHLSHLLHPLHYTNTFLFYIPTAILLRLAHCIEISHYYLSSLRPFEPFLTRAEVLKVGVTHWMRVDKAVEELGWGVVVGWEEGMERCAKWYRADGWDAKGKEEVDGDRKWMGGLMRVRRWLLLLLSCVLVLWMFGYLFR